jgi:hypothetical protein
VDDRDHTVSLPPPIGLTDGHWSAGSPQLAITVDRVSLVAAAVCPHPPLLVPQVAAGAAAELERLRAVAESTVRELTRAGADLLVVVGGGPRTFTVDNLQFGSLSPYGMPDESPSSSWSLSLLIGAWLLDRVGVTNPTSGVCVGDDLGAEECAAFGADLAATADRVAFLVMGDGSACRGAAAPGYDDPRAEPYDKEVAAALATADAEALLALDRDLSARLLVAGRAAWQVLAGAALASGRRWRGELHHDEAPYGVAYFVASWEPV